VKHAYPHRSRADKPIVSVTTSAKAVRILIRMMSGAAFGGGRRALLFGIAVRLQAEDCSGPYKALGRRTGILVRVKAHRFGFHALPTTSFGAGARDA
jgi:hypothetical protein